MHICSSTEKFELTNCKSCASCAVPQQQKACNYGAQKLELEME